MLVICDIDGTIACSRHRAHFVERPTPDWESFLNPALVAQDPVIPGAYEGLRRLTAIGADIVFLTGRNEGLRQVTEQWLDLNLGADIAKSLLVMRPLTDKESRASDYKRAALDKLRRHAAYGHRRWLAIDDDRYLWGVYASFGALVLKAPDCWSCLFPRSPETLPPEEAWRR